MGTRFVLSRKVQSSIAEGIELLRFGQFTEKDVKTLLIDLREVARYMVGAFNNGPDEYRRPLDEFIDVCDFIAHANRDRGLVERVARGYIETLYENTSLNISEFSKIPINGAINADHIVRIIGAVSLVALRDLAASIKSSEIKELGDRQADISICIMSLLQDSIISLKQQQGIGLLHLMPHEGKYRLYCRVGNSKIEREARARTGGCGKMSFGFPVMISNAECADPAILSLNYMSFPPPILETFRDSSGVLKVRNKTQDNK